MTFGPIGGVPVTVPVLVYWPRTAMPVFVHEAVPPGNIVPMVQIPPTLSSVTAPPVRVTLPVFVTL